MGTVAGAWRSVWERIAIVVSSPPTRAGSSSQVGSWSANQSTPCWRPKVRSSAAGLLPPALGVDPGAAEAVGAQEAEDDVLGREVEGLHRRELQGVRLTQGRGDHAVVTWVVRERAERLPARADGDDVAVADLERHEDGAGHRHRQQRRSVRRERVLRRRRTRRTGGRRRARALPSSTLRARWPRPVPRSDACVRLRSRLAGLLGARRPRTASPDRRRRRCGSARGDRARRPRRRPRRRRRPGQRRRPGAGRPSRTCTDPIWLAAGDRPTAHPSVLQIGSPTGAGARHSGHAGVADHGTRGDAARGLGRPDDVLDELLGVVGAQQGYVLVADEAPHRVHVGVSADAERQSYGGVAPALVEQLLKALGERRPAAVGGPAVGDQDDRRVGRRRRLLHLPHRPASTTSALPSSVNPFGTASRRVQCRSSTEVGSSMIHIGSLAKASTRTSSSACGLARASSRRCGSTSVMALLSAWIRPPRSIDPETSSTKMKWRGLRASAPPRRSLMSTSLRALPVSNEVIP